MEGDPTLVAFEIEDDLAAADRGAIEVRLHMTDGRDRWCFFMTPSAFKSCGDWVPGTRVRVHLGVAHMIVVSEIDEEVVRRTLEDLDQRGEIANHSLDLTTR